MKKSKNIIKKRHFKKLRTTQNNYSLFDKIYSENFIMNNYNISLIRKNVIKLILIILLLIIFFTNKNFENNYEIPESNYGLSLEQKMKDYAFKKFAVLRRTECWNCGLFSFYIVHLGCINHFLKKGYIPIIDLQSFKNIYNKRNKSIYNPWEIFFEQPYNYTLGEVNKYGKNIHRRQCTQTFYRPKDFKIYYDNSSLHFWHKIAKNFMPVKKEIMNEVNDIMKKFFGNSKNILGVMIRGTDYTTLRPKGHSVQPTVEQVIADVKIFDREYKYDYIFFATEDEAIRNKFIPEFIDKVKFIYSKDFKNVTNYNERVNKKLSSVKNYVLNIVILSKCLDIITSRTSGSAGVFIMSEGFRHFKVYNLGLY